MGHLFVGTGGSAEQNPPCTARRPGFILWSRRMVVLLPLILIASACGPSEPIRVTTIQLGRSLNSDDSINEHTTTFKPTETIYASAINEAAGAGTIAVRWVYAGQTVSQESKDVRFNREGATAFHMQAPSAGFPAGDYRVELQVNDQPAGVREFRVVK
jgi:hypothetical protein